MKLNVMPNLYDIITGILCLHEIDGLHITYVLVYIVVYDGELCFHYKYHLALLVHWYFVGW